MERVIVTQGGESFELSIHEYLALLRLKAEGARCDGCGSDGETYYFREGSILKALCLRCWYRRAHNRHLVEEGPPVSCRTCYGGSRRKKIDKELRLR